MAGMAATRAANSRACRPRGITCPAVTAILALLTLPAAPGPPAVAQEAGREAAQAPLVTVQADLRQERAAVGEPIILSVTVTHPPGLIWEPRSVSDALGPFDIEQTSGPLTALPEERAAGGGAASATTAWLFTLRAFELGELEIPPLELRWSEEPGGEVRAAATPALKILVEAGVADPNAAAADIRSGFALPPPSRLVLWAAAVGALLAAALAAWWWRRRPRRAQGAEPEPVKPAIPKRPAFDRWLEALEALLAERLLEKGMVKEFHVALAEIVKRYLGEVFAFDAVDRTTEETLMELERLARPTLRSETLFFLEACDRVKFAGHAPGPEECAESIARARRILDLGRPASSPAPGSAAASVARSS